MSRKSPRSEERFNANSCRNESDLHGEVGIDLKSEEAEVDFLNAFDVEDDADPEPEYGDFWFPRNEECD